jgi:protein-S-isoprenylcysteine O-methyltransferase Ste14
MLLDHRFALAVTPENIQLWTSWLWLLLLAVWLGFAPLAKRVVYRYPLRQRLAYGVPLLLAVYLLFSRAVPRAIHFLDLTLIHVTLPIAFAGLGLVVCGIAFSIWARFVLDGNWSGAATLKEGHTLTRTGPYRITRHPIYTGFLVALTGSAVEHGQLRSVIGLALCLVVVWMKLAIEERLMLERFGDEYIQYRREVPALFPLRLQARSLRSSMV